MSEKTKIHLVSLVSVDNDADLLPFFLEHYDTLGCDNNVVFLHLGEDPEASDLCAKSIEAFGWRCSLVPKTASFGGGALRKVLLDNFRKAAKPEDYIICPSADEFQIWTEPPSLAVEGGFDMVVGRLEDRFADTLSGIEEDATLEACYPNIHPHLTKILFPKRPRLRDKIVMAKVKIPVDYRKCFNVEGKPEGLRVDGIVPIHHYKWRDGIFDRLRTRPDYTREEIQSIKEFFELEPKDKAEV